MKLGLTQCIVDLEVGEVLWEDKPRSRLTTREVSLLRYLSTRMGADVSRDELHVEVWGYGVHTVSRAADDTVRRLRRKIEVNPKEPRHLLTVHGEGYRLLGTNQAVVSPQHIVLPLEHTPLIGRDDLLDTLKAALQVGRLVTLVGPGGVGKTRLAIRAAHELNGDGFVDAVEARTLEGLRDQIASQLHLHEPEDVQALAQRMAMVPGLVVLDNLEQVAEAAAEILSAWLAVPGEGKILVTSRARLGLPGERVIAVEPLEEGHGVQLLRQRLAQLGVAPVEQSKLFALQKTVEGLPLALELAAARVGGVGIDRVVERLAQDPTKLTAFRHTGPKRHRSVRATVQWSWDLLDPVEQQVLAQAAVFRGGVNLHALEVALDGQLPPDRDVDDCVAVLVEHALMKPGKKGRFRLALTVREVAESALSNRAEALRRHTMGVIASINVYWRNNVRALADLEGQRFLFEERDNLQCVLERVRGHDVDDWCKSVLCLASIWHSVGMVRRAREEVTSVLKTCESTRYAPHLLLVLGCATRAIEEEAAIDALSRAEAGLDAPQDRPLRMFCLLELLMIGANRGNDDKIADYFERAEALALHTPELQRTIEFSRCWVAFGKGLNEQALQHAQNLDTLNLNTIRRFAAQLLGLVVRFRLEREEATADRFRLAAQEALSLGDVFKQAFALTWAGRAELRAGQFGAAATTFGQAESIYRRGGAEEWAGYLNQYRQEALIKVNNASAQRASNETTGGGDENTPPPRQQE